MITKNRFQREIHAKLNHKDNREPVSQREKERESRDREVVGGKMQKISKIHKHIRLINSLLWLAAVLTKSMNDNERNFFFQFPNEP